MSVNVAYATQVGHCNRHGVGASCAAAVKNGSRPNCRQCCTDHGEWCAGLNLPELFWFMNGCVNSCRNITGDDDEDGGGTYMRTQDAAKYIGWLAFGSISGIYFYSTNENAAKLQAAQQAVTAERERRATISAIGGFLTADESLFLDKLHDAVQSRPDHSATDAEAATLATMMNGHARGPAPSLFPADQLAFQRRQAQDTRDACLWEARHEIKTVTPEQRADFRVGEIAMLPRVSANIQRQIRHAEGWETVTFIGGANATR